MKNIEKKKKIVEELKSLFDSSTGFFFISLKNINLEILNNLKKELKQQNTILKVAKKNLIKIANPLLKEKMEENEFKKPIGILFSLDINNLNIYKILQSYKDKNNLEILGGYIKNNFYLSDNLLSLSKFNTQEELYSKILLTLKYNLYNLINRLNFPLIKFLTVVSNIKK
jgi:ribosomal protein L10